MMMLLEEVVLLILLPRRMRTMTEIVARASPHWCEAIVTICKLSYLYSKRQEVVLYLDLLPFQLVFRRS